MPEVDLLVIAPHPDDAELICGGLLLKARRAGLRTGIVDVTEGEMATRGSVAIRRKETAAASKLLGLSARENLRLPDGHLHDNERMRVALVGALRRYRPQVIAVPHSEDQHPDHAAVGQAALYAAWLAGAPKFAPHSARGVASADRPPYRPRQVLQYNNRYGITPDLVVDVTDVFEDKLKLIACYASQFGPGNGQTKGQPQTRLSNGRFLEWLRGMHGFYGYKVSAQYGEPYCLKGPLGVRNVAGLF